MKNKMKLAAEEFVRSHSDDDQIAEEDLEAAFAALYGRPADDDDREQGLWSLCCAIAPVQSAQLTPCLFISRHEPTDEQKTLAAKAGYELFFGGDTDAFNPMRLDIASHGYRAVSVVHPAAALFLSGSGKNVLIFRNGTRASVAGLATFFAVGLTVFESHPAGDGSVEIMGLPEVTL